MFRENTSHLQTSFFDIDKQLPESKRKKLQESEENSYYHLIFRRIREKDFEGLYSENGSRPNAPVNRLVSSIILMNKRGWTTKQMMEQVEFNLLTRKAIGMNEITERAFCEATYFNFQNRILKHYLDTGENLIEKVFDGLTQEQLKELKIKTDIQRMDSFQAMSNIRSYGRVQLLIEVLIRLYRELSEEDKERFSEGLHGYTKQSAGQYIYNLEKSKLPHELEKLGSIYHKLYKELKEDYSSIEIFQIFKRVYEEHFTLVEEKITIKTKEELHSGMLQSPDDIEATYRKKCNEEYRGEVVNVAETANPENEINLLNDIGVYSNNTDDSDILNDRLDRITEKTPDLNELHTDGAYGSKKNDKKMEDQEIKHVQTEMRGRKSEKARMEIRETCDEEYEVECPKQKVKSEKARKRNKVCFDEDICGSCEYSQECPAQKQKGGRVYYFDHSTYLLDKRRSNMSTLPPERRNLRPNVEATVKEFKNSLNHKGKLRVRGLFKTEIYAYSMGIGINFGRIHRYLKVKPKMGKSLNIDMPLFLQNIAQIFIKISRKICQVGMRSKITEYFGLRSIISSAIKETF